MRVLQNQQRIAAELAQSRQQQPDGQAQMPLIAEVKERPKPKRSSRPARRARREFVQSGLDEV